MVKGQGQTSGRSTNIVCLTSFDPFDLKLPNTLTRSQVMLQDQTINYKL